MTPDDIRTVQATFDRVRPHLEPFTTVFYERLFATSPRMRWIFHTDQRTQGRLLGEMLTAIVAGLDRLDNLGPALWYLGRRHMGYGVAERDYQVFGDAMMWTLERILGARWNPEVAAAWRSFYDQVSGLMTNRRDFHKTAAAGLAA